jgi:hypothetical protein
LEVAEEEVETLENRVLEDDNKVEGDREADAEDAEGGII